jgi:hypothetical protein
MAVKWYERYQERLKAEVVIMRERFPQFVLKKDSEGLFWEGILRTNLGTHYSVVIEYPKNYPYVHPVSRVLHPAIRRNSPHRYPNGSLCVYPENWDYKRCTATAAIPLVAGWLAMYEIWLKTGQPW